MCIKLFRIKCCRFAILSTNSALTTLGLRKLVFRTEFTFACNILDYPWIISNHLSCDSNIFQICFVCDNKSTSPQLNLNNQKNAKHPCLAKMRLLRAQSYLRNWESDLLQWEFIAPCEKLIDMLMSTIRNGLNVMKKNTFTLIHWIN